MDLTLGHVRVLLTDLCLCGRLRFEMLALMKHQMVLLEERFAAFTDMRTQSTATVRMTAMVLQQTMLRRETFATAGTEMSFWFLLWCDWHGSYNGRLLLRLLLLLLLLLGLLLVLDVLLLLNNM